MTALRVERLVVRYGDVTALDQVSLEIEQGDVLAVLGPSGSGKTTLLNAVAGFVEVDGGEIFIDDRLVASRQRSMPTEDRGVGVVFQSYGLWPHLSAVETVAYPLRRQGQRRAEAEATARQILARVGLAGLEHRRPDRMSGGQQQRVGLARALARSPRLFLFDEPTANLDSSLRSGLQEQIREQQGRTGAAAVYVTHDPVEAFAVADRVAVIRDARLVQIDTPREVYANPADAWTARLTGPCSTFSAEVLDGKTLRIGDAVAPGITINGLAPDAVCGTREATLAVRPEWIRFGDPGEHVLAATVRRVTFAGAEAVCTLDTPVGAVIVRVPGATRVAAGDVVSWQPTTVCVLAADATA